MSIPLFNLVLKTNLKLSPSRRHILSLLAYHANDNKDLLCCPSIETLSHETGWSSRQIIRDLKYLHETGIIKKERQWKNNYYVINEDILKNETSDKNYTISHDPRSPEEDLSRDPRSCESKLSGDCEVSSGDCEVSSGDTQVSSGDCGSPYNIYNYNIKKNITENFLENEKK